MRFMPAYLDAPDAERLATIYRCTLTQAIMGLLMFAGYGWYTRDPIAALLLAVIVLLIDGLILGERVERGAYLATGTVASFGLTMGVIAGSNPFVSVFTVVVGLLLTTFLSVLWPPSDDLLRRHAPLPLISLYLAACLPVTFGLQCFT